MRTHSTAPGRLRIAVALVIAAIVVVAGTASAEIVSLWYKEAIHQGTIYVFNSAETLKGWQTTHEIKGGLTKKAYGPSGETVVFENETALDLYNLKHNKEPEARPAPKPSAPPSNPTRLKIGSNGEIWFGGLFQGWYVGDTSPAGTGTDWLGNNTGQNTFRIRRAEMKMAGKWNDFNFEVMIDPSKQINTAAGTDGKILQDLAVGYTGIHGQEFLIGQKKIDLFEEGMRSSSELWFGERAQVTRAFGDIRQMGFFYKGELGEKFTLWSAITNGTVTNNISDTNDTVLYTGRLDFRPMKGLTIGTTGGTGATGGGMAHRSRYVWSGHVKYGGYDVPGSRLWLEAEYGSAGDDQANGTRLNRWGFYVSALYIFGDNFQVGFRYDRLNNNKDVPMNYQTIYTTGLHWLPLWKNANVKAEWYYVDQDNRKVNGVSHCCYSEFLLAAQAAF
jgi:hypothetical protein